MNRRFPTAALFVVLGTLAVAQAPQPAAQAPQSKEPAAAREQRPTFRAGASYVRVDVYPTADGRPVQDLRQEEFEVLEDGVPQKIETFEHVLVAAAGSEDTRSEPNSVRESRQMAADPRARLFVLFIDTYHVSGSSGYNVRTPLVNLLDRAIGQHDLIAVMTPEMSAGSVTFARKTGTVQEILDKYWDYGKRHRIAGFDPDENMFMACYSAEMAREMIDRRREKMTLDALEDLVVHLQGLREERKAIIAVSEGWRLYRPNSNLARPVNERVPGPPPVGVGPDGRMRTGDLGGMGTDLYRCDQERIRLAQEDHDLQFRELVDLANRANASFYPIDPRGLPVFDNPIGPTPPPPAHVDQQQLGSRIETLRTLAGATDGLAIVNSNDIERGVRRVVDDLTSYYLVGYYSGNTKADGRFRSISVKVKRAGVSVRARRGYRAPTKEDLEAREAAARTAGGPASTPVTNAVTALGRIRYDAFVQASAGYDWNRTGEAAPQPSMWVVAELDANAGSRDEQWKAGAEVTVTVTGPDKTPVAEVRQTLTRQARSARLRIPAEGVIPPGDYAVRVSSKPVGATLGSSEMIRLTVPAAPGGDALLTGHPRLLRRGPFSGAGWQPAGDVRFRRQERVRAEFPVVGGYTASSLKLLDRNGNELGIPIAASEREENGVRILAGDVTLAPLTTGDYLFEATLERQGTTKKVVTGFRIIP